MQGTDDYFRAARLRATGFFAGLRATFRAAAFFAAGFRTAGFLTGLRATLRATAFFAATFRTAGFLTGRFTDFFAATDFLAGLRTAFLTGFFAADAVDFRAALGRFLATGLRAFDVFLAIFFAGISLPPSGMSRSRREPSLKQVV